MSLSLPPKPVCYEDQACWDWRLMGNHCRGLNNGRVLECAITNDKTIILIVRRKVSK